MCEKPNIFQYILISLQIIWRGGNIRDVNKTQHFQFYPDIWAKLQFMVLTLLIFQNVNWFIRNTDFPENSFWNISDVYVPKPHQPPQGAYFDTLTVLYQNEKYWPQADFWQHILDFCTPEMDMNFVFKKKRPQTKIADISETIFWKISISDKPVYILKIQ